MKYFAYGMNTNLNEMVFRCPDAVSLGGAVLPDHEFRFARHADVVYYPGFDTLGVLWEITDECERALDALEGFPTYYLKKTVSVVHEGEEVEAMVYYMTGDVADEAPSDGYLMMLYEGYAQHDISALQIVESLDYINAYHTALAKKGQFFYG
jgi:gamma-glutamylcyclotransferase (GGCT)/AIG2-like uncharacterized protein YtfP